MGKWPGINIIIETSFDRDRGPRNENQPGQVVSFLWRRHLRSQWPSFLFRDIQTSMMMWHVCLHWQRRLRRRKAESYVRDDVNVLFTRWCRRSTWLDTAIYLVKQLAVGPRSTKHSVHCSPAGRHSQLPYRMVEVNSLHVQHATSRRTVIELSN
jgi:hypothetical protein